MSKMRCEVVPLTVEQDASQMDDVDIVTGIIEGAIRNLVECVSMAPGCAGAEAVPSGCSRRSA